MYCGILLLQRKPKLGRTKPSPGPRVGHSCSRACYELLNWGRGKFEKGARVW